MEDLFRQLAAVFHALLDAQFQPVSGGGVVNAAFRQVGLGDVMFRVIMGIQVFQPGGVRTAGGGQLLARGRPEVLRHGQRFSVAHVIHGGIDAHVGGIALGGRSQVNGGVRQRDARLRHADHFRRARRVQRHAQGVGVCQPHVFRRGDDQPSPDEADVLPGFQHHPQPVQGGVRIRAAHGLDEGGNRVVMGISQAVVLDGLALDGFHRNGEVHMDNAVFPGRGGQNGHFQSRDGLPGVSVRLGGQGSRLYALTQKLAKPAVPFGGKYRIIDFPLSNCVNSDIDTVGILTQYQPLVLNEYIGNGQPWDLDRLHGGVHVLPPYQQATGSDWYKGTANAIYQNISFIDRYDPQYVIILSGDQICKQDYADFLRFHKEKNAEFSVAVMEVPWSEAPRFGLMVTDENDRISEFQEKPKNPKSNLASMGIYIFNWDILKKYLTEDENDPNSENDFGKNVIPALLRDNRRMYAYRFSGYWKDVGTISSLWQANMEVLDPTHSGINLFDENWKIYSRNSGRPCQRIGTDADIVNSMITEGCQVDGTVKNSILFPGVVVEKGATVEAAVVMGGTVIKAGAKVEHCIVAENVTIEEGATVGKMPESGLNITEPGDVATVGSGVKIGKGATVGPKAMISNDVKDGEEQW